MAVTITKSKPGVKPKVESVAEVEVETIDPEKMTIEQLADAYGSLEDATGALLADPKFSRFKEVAAELSKRIAKDYEPLQELLVKGEHWHLDVGAAAKSPAEITDLGQVRKLMGDKTFMQVASVTLTNVKKYLTPEQLATVLNEDTGYTARRKITAKFMG